MIWTIIGLILLVWLVSLLLKIGGGLIHVLLVIALVVLVVDLLRKRRV